MAKISQEQARDALRAHGKRVTSQRNLILQIVRESRGHLDASEIYRRARSKDPRISLSTVYRNLNLLEELGLISELHLDQEHHHYELKEGMGHHHLICTNCDKVIEFDSPLVADLVSQVSQEQGFRVDRVQIDLVGLCEECRAKKTS
jgi:Fur family ferric uptake transcriptional regulator